jgi:hypothetical protein
MCDECAKRIDDLSERFDALAARHVALAETVFSAMLISDARTLDALSQQLARRIDGAVSMDGKVRAVTRHWAGRVRSNHSAGIGGARPFSTRMCRHCRTATTGKRKGPCWSSLRFR